MAATGCRLPSADVVTKARVVMLHYPKIPGSRECPGGRCVAFEKYDGTNLHWDWDRDFGWHAFGTRRDAFNLLPAGLGQFSHAHGHLGQAPALFLATLAAGLDRAFHDNDNYRGFGTSRSSPSSSAPTPLPGCTG